MAWLDLPSTFTEGNLHKLLECVDGANVYGFGVASGVKTLTMNERHKVVSDERKSLLTVTNLTFSRLHTFSLASNEASLVPYDDQWLLLPGDWS